MENIPLPSKIEINKKDENQAVFTFEPLYPGYGTTLGNALRRVMLSSLPGAAVQAVKIKGVDHEFSTIPHVKEDVIGLILNLKQIRFKFFAKEPVKLNLKVKGEKTVSAGDIKTTSDVEIVNKKLKIATLTDKEGSLEMEITVSDGRGYIPVESREKEIHEIGTIDVDAIYTPIKNITFDNENVRVEQMTNYDRLILNITTDGTISPSEALKMAAGILVDQFNYVKELKVNKPKEVESKKEIKEEKAEEKKEVLIEETKEGELEKPAKKKRGRPKKSETQKV
ncbi:MAG: DNA-directed RNA polymerase subunit alpha [Patescibacteria group bacterium]